MNIPTAEAREFAMLDPEQITTLNALERMGATLSLFGISLIFVTFAIFKRLRTISNTFIFFASIANIGACVACLIAYDGITAMNRDRWSPLCQAQGFIFEWFMQSDPWWSFAMAINVYMVFFMSFNPIVFRNYLWLYCLLCYGLPAIPAFVFLFIRLPDEPVYGDAVLWCWIASKWNSLRIYSYYLPIWICSLLSAVIYFAVGYHVFHQRNQLRNLSLSNQGQHATGDSSNMRDSAEKKLTSHPDSGYYGTVTTEVQVTSAAITASPIPAYTNPFRETSPTQRDVPTRWPSDSMALRITTSVESSDPLDIFSPPVQNAPGALSPVHTHNYPWSREPSSFPAGPDADAALVKSHATFGLPSPPARMYHASSYEATSQSFNTTNYTSISAGSSSPKRDHRGPSPTQLLSHVSKRSTSDDPIVLPPAAATVKRSDPDGGPEHISSRSGGGGDGGGGSSSSNAQGNILRRMSYGTRRFGARLRHMDPVKLAYLRTSFVFAISILVTWTPSSINRVYTLIYPDKASYGLNIAAAVVLPLQGVWNAVIYFTTSWKIFREEVEATRGGRRLLRLLRLDSLSRGSSTGGNGVEGSRGRQSGSFALGSSVRTPRSEMGRSRRLDGESHDGEGVELRSPMSSPMPPRRRPYAPRRNTMRVTQKGLGDFA